MSGQSGNSRSAPPILEDGVAGASGGAGSGTAAGDGSTAHGATASVRAGLPQLVRAEPSQIVPRVHANATFLGRLLGIPLRLKLIGASLLLVVAASIAMLLARRASFALEILSATLLASMIVNYALVLLALRPLRDLEETATRVWKGDLEARVPPSPLADRDMVRVGSTLNLLLDSLVADRSRMRQLAAQVIRAQDEERARLARELHDSTAQTLAAAMYQLSAVSRQTHDLDLLERLDELRQLVADAIEEVRTLSHTIHPRVLEDLGLTAALEWLARQAREQRSASSAGGGGDGGGGIEIVVEARPCAEAGPLPPHLASVLYRVAQESLRNALQHADAKHIRIALSADGSQAVLAVADDGRGFDLQAAQARRPGMGLFSIRERVALVNGTVDIQSEPGKGSTVTARVPLHGAAA